MNSDMSYDWHCEICRCSNHGANYSCSICHRVRDIVITSDGNRLHRPLYFPTPRGNGRKNGRGYSMSHGVYISEHNDQRSLLLSVAGGDVHSIRLTPDEWDALCLLVNPLMDELRPPKEEEAA